MDLEDPAPIAPADELAESWASSAVERALACARTLATAFFFGKFSAEFRSFSAVSAPIFASKYAFGSIFQNLPDYLLFSS